MDSDSRTYSRDCACALVANKVVADYCALIALGVGVEIESLVEKWIKNNTTGGDECFVQQVMSRVGKMLKERADAY